MARYIQTHFAPTNLAIVLFTLLLTAIPARAQNGEDALRFAERFPGVTAANIGMAGAGIAGVPDASALFLNPAGLGLARVSTVSGAFYSLASRDASVFQLPTSRSTSEADVLGSGLGSLAYVYKTPTSRGALVFAAAINQSNSYTRELYFEGFNGRNSITDFFMPLADEFEFEEEGGELFPSFSRTLSFIGFETFAIDLDQDLFDAGEPVPFLPAVSAGTILQTGSVIESGRMHEFNFGAAFEASKGIFMGVSVNIPYGTYRFERLFEELDIDNENDGFNGTTDFDFLQFVEFFESDIVGVNLRAGLSAEISPQMRVGLTIETPTLLSVEDTYGTTLLTEFDNGDFFEYGNDRDENAGSGVFDYEITTPWHIGAGVTYSQSGLTVSADAEVIDWSQLELSSEGFSFAVENSQIRRQLDAVVNARVGVSYENGPYTVRGGFAFYPDPRDPAFSALTDGAVDKDRTFISAGFGYRINKNLRADLGWMQERYDDVYRPYTEVTDAPFVSEEITRNRFLVGLTYSF